MRKVILRIDDLVVAICNSPLYIEGVNNANGVTAMNINEHQTANYLVALALKRGYTVGVFDGEELTVDKSTEQATIMQALGTTDADTLVVRSSQAPFQTVASFLLVYGNGAGDLIADYSGRDEADELFASVVNFADALEV